MALSGCAATVQRPAATTATESAFKVPPAASKRVALFIQKNPSMYKSDDWELFRTEWRTAVASTASAAGKQFTYLEVEPASAAEAGTVMSSSAWQGIFSAMTDKQVAAIATEMIKELDR